MTKWNESDFMNFKIKNFGKISEANIKLDGITVICGNNNTGKSTVGKALFSFFNSLYDYKSKIDTQKSTAVRNFVLTNAHIWEVSYNIFDNDNPIPFITAHSGDYSIDEVKSFLETDFNIKATKEKIVPLVNNLNLSNEDIMNEYIFRYFGLVMNNQVKNLHSANRSQCSVCAKIKDKKIDITLNKKVASCTLTEPIEHSAYYINSPFALDWLNQPNLTWFLSQMSPLDRNVIAAIAKAQAGLTEDSMTNILDSVINKKDLDEVRNILKKAYSGDTIINQGKFYYSEDGFDFDFRNISAGLKSFALIERLLETGALKRKDVLILDEPEIHLHSEWQIIYAELIVVLQKVFDLTILLVTHSFQFLESLNFFMKKYDISERGNYYIPTATENGFVIDYNEDNLEKMKENLSTGTFKIADLEYEYDMERDDDDE